MKVDKILSEKDAAQIEDNIQLQSIEEIQNPNLYPILDEDLEQEEDLEL